MSLGADITSLAEAREHVREHAAAGVSCPCCDQLVKIYKRKVYRDLARGLVKLAVLNRGAREQFFHIRDIEQTFKKPSSSLRADFAKLALFGLIESPDVGGGKRNSGLWRVTGRGEAFVRGSARIPGHLLVQNGGVIGLSPETVSISDALEQPFDFREVTA